jgi:hypothetical protein
LNEFGTELNLTNLFLSLRASFSKQNSRLLSKKKQSKNGKSKKFVNLILADATIPWFLFYYKTLGFLFQLKIYPALTVEQLHTFVSPLSLYTKGNHTSSHFEF